MFISNYVNTPISARKHHLHAANPVSPGHSPFPKQMIAHITACGRCVGDGMSSKTRNRSRAVSRYGNLTYQRGEITISLIFYLFQPNKHLLLYEIYHLYCGNYIFNNLNVLPRVLNVTSNPCHAIHKYGTSETCGQVLANSVDYPIHQSHCHPLVQLSQCFDFLPFIICELCLAALHITIPIKHRTCTGFFYPSM